MFKQSIHKLFHCELPNCGRWLIVPKTWKSEFDSCHGISWIDQNQGSVMEKILSVQILSGKTVYCYLHMPLFSSVVFVFMTYVTTISVGLPQSWEIVDNFMVSGTWSSCFVIDVCLNRTLFAMFYCFIRFPSANSTSYDTTLLVWWKRWKSWKNEQFWKFKSEQ